MGDIFGPRTEVCGEAGYKFFLTELGTQASTACRKKGSEQEVRLLAIREILNRFPLRVRFSDSFWRTSVAIPKLGSSLPGVAGTRVLSILGPARFDKFPFPIDADHSRRARVVPA